MQRHAPLQWCLCLNKMHSPWDSCALHECTDQQHLCCMHLISAALPDAMAGTSCAHVCVPLDVKFDSACCTTFKAAGIKHCNRLVAHAAQMPATFDSIHAFTACLIHTLRNKFKAQAHELLQLRNLHILQM